MTRLVPALALAVAACATPPPPAPVAPPTPPGPVAPAGGAFNAPCETDDACASHVCFHKRIKTADAGPEWRDGPDALDRAGYCSMACDASADCPAPPTTGRCGARGMCKRAE